MSRLPAFAAVVCLAAVAVGAWIASQRARTHHDGYDVAAAVGPAPAFALQRSDGSACSERDLRGSVALVYFGFTTCPDVCPTELGWMARVLRELGPLAARVQPVFITIDPERDTPQLLAEYATLFHPRMLALRGDAAATRAAADAFGVTYRKQTPVSQQGGFYLLDHTMTTFVLDREGRIALRLSSHDLTPAAAAAQIRPLAGAVP